MRDGVAGVRFDGGGVRGAWLTGLPGREEFGAVRGFAAIWKKGLGDLGGIGRLGL